MELREVTYLAVVMRILAASFAGGIIGLEREIKNRPAGLRTYIVVCMGACLIMLTNQYIFQVFGVGDPVRLGAQVVSGIGFLGAGTIMVTRRNQIKGLTTAAGLWVAAGIGLAIGIGFYEAAFAATFAVFFVMTLLQGLDRRMHRKVRSVEVFFDLEVGVSLGAFLAELRNEKLELHELQQGTGYPGYFAVIKSEKRRYPTEILQIARSIPLVTYLEEV